MANTPLRSVRVADEIWQPALAKAEAEEENMKMYIMMFLKD
jgi:hypothetical protein